MARNGAAKTDLEKYLERISNERGLTRADRERLKQRARQLANAKGDLGPVGRSKLNAEFRNATSRRDSANPPAKGGGSGNSGGGNSGSDTGGGAGSGTGGDTGGGAGGGGGSDTGGGNGGGTDTGGDTGGGGTDTGGDTGGGGTDGGTDTGGGDGGGGDGEPTTTKPQVPGYDFYWDGTKWVAVKTTDPSDDEAAKQSAVSYLTDLLNQYGLDELIPTVADLVKEWGNNSNVIVSKLRQTTAYRQRFAGNEQRIKNGYNAISEAEYLSAEDAIKTTMRRYGLADDYYSRDKLATLIGGDVSATEVDSRIGQAKKVIDNADPNIKSSLVSLYGASMSDMLGYVLAPETALEVVQRRVNAGFASGVALGAGIDLGVGLSEQVGDLTMGDERTLRAQFANIGDLARSTSRLASIDNEAVSSQDVVRGEFGIDQQADQKVKRLQSRERARFSGQSATGSSTLSGGGA